MALTSTLVPSCTQMLQALSAWLAKATAHSDATGGDPDHLLTQRLAPDMYPLSSQVCFACFQAQEPIYRLRGQALPEVLEMVRQEGWSAGEKPGSMQDAQARIKQALSFLAGVGAHALDAEEDRRIELQLPNGIVFENMTGGQYVRDWALPQFYFHLSMAYAILRNQGVALGKADFVAHMFAYIRPGSMPQG